ncbi:hypothetical protein ACFL4A_03770 [bacterium]
MSNFNERLEVLKSRKMWKKVLELFASYALFFVLFTIVFYSVWSVLVLPGFVFVLVEVPFVFLFVYLMKMYLRKYLTDDLFAIYYFLKNHFVFYAVVGFFYYFGVPSEGPIAYEKSLAAHVMVVSFILMLIYLVKYIRMKKSLAK